METTIHYTLDVKEGFFSGTSPMLSVLVTSIIVRENMVIINGGAFLPADSFADAFEKVREFLSHWGIRVIAETISLPGQPNRLQEVEAAAGTLFSAVCAAKDSLSSQAPKEVQERISLAINKAKEAGLSRMEIRK